MKAPAFLTLVALLLAPLAVLLGAEGPPKTQFDSVPFMGSKVNYACYRCPTLAISAKGTVLAFCEWRINSHKDEDSSLLCVGRWWIAPDALLRSSTGLNIGSGE